MARGATTQHSPFPSPGRRRPKSLEINNSGISTARAKRPRHGQAPTYKDLSEEDEEDTIDFTSRKRRRILAGAVINGDSNGHLSVRNVALASASLSNPRSKKANRPTSGADRAQAEQLERYPQSQPFAPNLQAADNLSSATKSEDRAVTKNANRVKSKASAKVDEEKPDTDEEAIDRSTVKPKRRRKTQEEKDAAAMPLAPRSVGLKVFIGAHVSAAGGVHNSVTNSVHIGGNAFALFQKSQRKWNNPSISPDHVDQFKSLCTSHNYAATSHIVPHGSYLVNLAQPDPTKAQQAYDAFLDDLSRSESLGIKLYNFHPGNTNGAPRSEAIGRIAKRLNAAHKSTKTVVTLLENMAASPSGNTIGGSFQDLRDVIDQIDDKTRVGVCLDTCHTFAAGYDLRSPEAFAKTMTAFDEVVGFQYLRAVHLNDSKAPLAAHRDLHQNIGLGFLGLRAFHNLVNDSRFAGLPLILETPIDKKDDNGKVVEDKRVWAQEIKLLESLVDMDAEGTEFRRLEADLAARGAVERAKYQDQFDKKRDKDAKKVGSQSAGQRKRRESTEDRDDEE